MKTQIQNLIDGSENVLRDLDHPKYHPAADEPVNITGTDPVIRRRIADKVVSENPETLSVRICGISVKLKMEHLGIGNIFWYSTRINREEYLQISGREELPFLSTKAAFILLVSGDMKVSMSAFPDKYPDYLRSELEVVKIGEEFVEIL